MTVSAKVTAKSFIVWGVASPLMTVSANPGPARW